MVIISPRKHRVVGPLPNGVFMAYKLYLGVIRSPLTSVNWGPILQAWPAGRPYAHPMVKYWKQPTFLSRPILGRHWLPSKTQVSGGKLWLGVPTYAPLGSMESWWDGIFSVFFWDVFWVFPSIKSPMTCKDSLIRWAVPENTGNREPFWRRPWRSTHAQIAACPGELKLPPSLCNNSNKNQLYVENRLQLAAIKLKASGQIDISNALVRQRSGMKNKLCGSNDLQPEKKMCWAILVLVFPF